MAEITPEASREEVLALAEREAVRFVELEFMDIHGVLKSMTIPVERLGKALTEGVVFDGSSIVGYATIDESDMRAVPDPRTFRVLPWAYESSPKLRTAHVICDIYTQNGDRFKGDPRFVLERQLERLREEGDWRFNVGPEYEFFLLPERDGVPRAEPSDLGGYFDWMPHKGGDIVRREAVHYLSMMGIEAEATHHEVAPGQHEIDLRYADAMESADRVFVMKQTIKAVAERHGLHATFMPKPIYGVCGNGMHVHQSLQQGDRNLFYDEGDRYGLSKLAYRYLGGLIAHARSTCAVLASWVNSYKRLVPGFEAPVYVSWARTNRSALIRVPAGRGMATRFEVRNPDPAGNPYLQFAVMLASGMDGIRHSLEPPEPVEMDIFALSPKEREDLGIEPLPENLGHALAIMAESRLVREVLGDHIFEHFLAYKTQEWEAYRAQVTPWEHERYLWSL